MQELLFRNLTPYTKINAPFDDYVVSSYKVVEDKAAIVFHRVDANGKRHYLVADRVPTSNDPSKLVLTNAKEFRHAIDRAHRHYNQRIRDLGTR